MWPLNALTFHPVAMWFFSPLFIASTLFLTPSRFLLQKLDTGDALGNLCKCASTLYNMDELDHMSFTHDVTCKMFL